MKFIDMHCDTLMTTLLQTDGQTDMLRLPSGMVDFERMKKGGSLAQFFAIFMVPQEDFRTYFHMEPMSEEEYIQGCLNILKTSLISNSDLIAPALSAKDILQNEKDGKMSAVLTMEDGVAVHGKLDRIKDFYDMGVRVLGLTWNQKNCFGSPNSKDPGIMQEGLTDFGKEAVIYMQELGMMVDVSHLSDGGFYDVAALCKKPFMATHSNCRALCPHQRNLTDDMIKVLAEHGGVAGINFGPEFLNENLADRHSRAVRMAEMMLHMKRIGGIDVIGIGTDFDGISGELEIADSLKMQVLVQELERKHFTIEEIEKIMYKNVLRVMKDSL